MFTELTPQQNKALNFKKSLSLKANAGSGKTLVLAKRYLQIALYGNVSIQRIAAITFTEKAAGELYKRITEEIELALNVSVKHSDIKKLEKIRRQLVSANISTIHSFCINILKEFPVESEIDANFTPIDQNTSTELMELSIEETLSKQLDDQDNKDCRFLIRLFGSKRNLVMQIRNMINSRRIVSLLAETIYNKEAKSIAAHFSNEFVKYSDLIFRPGIRNLSNILTKINKAVLADEPRNKIASNAEKLLLDLNEADNITNQLAVIENIKNTVCTKNLRFKTRGYIGSDLRSLFEEDVKEIEMFFKDVKNFSISTNSAKIEHTLALTGKYLIQLFNDTMYVYDQKKLERGYLDYEDILIKTKNLLEPGRTRRLLSEKFDYLMVDEYQDTNELQYEIFMPVLNYLKQGNLFVVGDDKQSIYRFREAELEVFQKTDSDILEKSGSDYLMTLPDSFRMDPVICLFTNHLFQKLFTNPNKLFNEVNHSDLVCAKQDSTGGKVSILIAESDSELTEAELIARKILDLVYVKDSGISWKDIGVLVRKRDNFSELEKKFIERNIPYRIIGGRGFFQRQSIYDIFNYFSFLLDTYNDAALVGVLRSPFYSLSDLKIYEISLNDGKTYWDKLQNCNSDDESIIKIVNKLKKNLEQSGDCNFSTIMRTIFEETDFISVLASKPDGEQEQANLEKLQRLTNSFMNQGFKTLYDYVNFLKEAIIKLDDEAQEGLAGQADAVNILTIHQAKGLEFEAAFLFKCHGTSRADTTKSKSISIDKRFGILTKVPDNERYFSEYISAPVVAIRDYIENRENMAEVKRLFYVAVTRARQQLFLSATNEGKGFSSSSFMGMLIESLKLNVDEEEHIINGDLSFLHKQDGGYSNIKKKISYKIPIIRDLHLPDVKIDEEIKRVENNKFVLNEISDNSKGEIISATKVAAFIQCPLKYNLIYHYGYSSLYSEFDKGTGTDLLTLNYNDEGEHSNEASTLSLSSLAIIKGQIVHKILQKEIRINKLEQFISEEINTYSFELLNISEVKESFINDTIELVSSFYNSDEYEMIQSFGNYKNELEIYLSERDYFLYGIIDKLIIDDKKIIIVDYKTDDISLELVNERANYYIEQLNFYVNIVRKLYKEFEQIEIRIIFLNHPDNPFSRIYKRNDIDKIEDKILDAINGILRYDSSKNYDHCKACNFSVKNSCII